MVFGMVIWCGILVYFLSFRLIPKKLMSSYSEIYCFGM